MRSSDFFSYPPAFLFGRHQIEHCILRKSSSTIYSLKLDISHSEVNHALRDIHVARDACSQNASLQSTLARMTPAPKSL